MFVHKLVLNVLLRSNFVLRFLASFGAVAGLLED